MGAVLRPRGLTVIEIMIAVAVFAVAIVTIIGVYPVSARAARQAQGHLVATNLAEKELEFSRAMDYDAIETRSEQYLMEFESNGARTQIDFTTEVEVQEPRTGLKQIVVTVNYLGTDNFRRSLRMETYVARLSP